MFKNLKIIIVPDQTLSEIFSKGWICLKYNVVHKYFLYVWLTNQQILKNN